MKAIVMSSLIVLGMTSLPTSAEEVSSKFTWGDIVFQPRIYAGYADYQLKSSNFKVTFTKRLYKNSITKEPLE